MTSKTEPRTVLGIGRFAALKTAIVTGDEKSVRDLLPTEPMAALEISYLIDLAELNGNPGILTLLENAPVRK
ncbi:MAG TPA: hypothetical protein VIC26_04865 [Marinagarivorans sp.]